MAATKSVFAVLVTALIVGIAAPSGAFAATEPEYSGEVGGTGVANRNAAQALQGDWLAAVAAAGGTADSPIVLSSPGVISGTFYTAPDSMTASVLRTRYTAGTAPTYVGPSSNPGTASCVANGSGAANAGAGMQGNAPRPTTLVGGSGCPAGYSYGEFGGVGEGDTRDAVEFTFSRPVLAFGAWFGDLETRTDGLGVAAIVRLYDADNSLLSEAEVTCSVANAGCGDGTTRWVGFVADPSEPVVRMVVIVGDDDAGGNALDEGIGFIGPTFDLSRASLALTKTADPLADTNGDLVIGAGDTVSYNFAVENSGTLDVSSLSIVDAQASGLSCPLDSLAPGESTTCTGSHVLTQAEVDAGTLTNTAYATAAVYNGTIQSVTSSVTLDIPRVSSLFVAKTVDALSTTYSEVGDTLTFDVAVSNTGNVTLTGVTISDPAPGDGAFDATACQSLPTTLVPGDGAQCAVTYTVTQDDLDAGSLTNTVTVSAVGPDDSAVGPVDDDATSVAVQSTSLSLAKTVDAATFSSVGQILTYTLTLRNAGNVTLGGVQVIDTAPGTGAFDASDCTALDGSTLAPGAELECTVTYTVTQADLNGGSLDNRADATALTPGNVEVAAPQASVTSTASTTSELSITKIVDAPTYDSVGDLLTFTVTVTNVGTVTLTSVGVTDSGPGAGDCATLSVTLDPTESIQCTVSYSVAQADLNAGSVSNTAFATATAPGGPITSSSAGAQSDAVQSLSLSLQKTTPATEFDSVGDVLTYTLTATNTGNVSLTAVAITDPPPGAGAYVLDCSGLAVTLEPTDSTACTATYTVTQADLDSGHVNNVASASAESTTGASVVAPDATATTPAVQFDSLTLAKSVSQASFDSVGDQLDYTLTATNSGNVTLTSVAISDAAPGAGAFVSDCPAVIADLSPGEPVTCTATYTVDQTDLDYGSVTNTATSTGVTPNSDTAASGPAQAMSSAVQSTSLVLEKTADRTAFSSVGDLVTYALTITNTGNTSIGSVTIDDSAPGTGSFSSTCPLVFANLAPGESASCTSHYAVTALDISAGLISSVAVGQGLVPPVVVFSNVELVTLPFEPAPSGLATTGTPAGVLWLAGLSLMGAGVAAAAASSVQRRHRSQAGLRAPRPAATGRR